MGTPETTFSQVAQFAKFQQVVEPVRAQLVDGVEELRFPDVQTLQDVSRVLTDQLLQGATHLSCLYRSRQLVHQDFKRQRTQKCIQPSLNSSTALFKHVLLEEGDQDAFAHTDDGRDSSETDLLGLLGLSSVRVYSKHQNYSLDLRVKKTTCVAQKTV